MSFPTFSKSSKSWEQLDNIVKFLRRASILQGVEKVLLLEASKPITIHHQINRKVSWVITNKDKKADVWSTSNIPNSLTLISDADVTLTIWVY